MSMTTERVTSLGVGIIGAGRMGALRAEALVRHVPQARVVAIADANPAAADQVAARLGIPRATGDPTALLVDPDIGALLICSPTDSHAAWIRAGAAAGKHLFVEKPIALDLAQTDAALDAVAQAGVRMQVGMNRRFDPTYARLREAIAQGAVGDVHLLHIISRDPAPPPISYVRTSGGLFLDMAIHDLDMARFLVGAEVRTVYAQGAVRISAEIGAAGDIDTALTVLTFANDVFATIDNSRQAVYGYDQRAEVFGSKGALSTENVYPNEVIFRTAEHIRRDLPLHFFLERYAESYRREMCAFVDAILSGARPTPDGADARAALVLGLAAQRSLELGRPVAVSEI